MYICGITGLSTILIWRLIWFAATCIHTGERICHDMLWNISTVVYMLLGSPTNCMLTPTMLAGMLKSINLFSEIQADIYRCLLANRIGSKPTLNVAFILMIKINLSKRKWWYDHKRNEPQPLLCGIFTFHFIYVVGVQCMSIIRDQTSIIRIQFRITFCRSLRDMASLCTY